MKPDARARLLDAALAEIRRHGYAATSVDELCDAAGVTKGAFFHHFRSKEALAIAAADHWSATTGTLFAGAPYHQHQDPLDRVLAYVDFRKELVRGEIPDFTCLVGTMAQEIYAASEGIRDACWRSISGHATTLEGDIGEAIAKYGAKGVEAKSLALFTQATIQGAFILAKAKNDAGVAVQTVDHLKRYFELLFGRGERKETRDENPSRRRRSAEGAKSRGRA
jgi:TetR/AcrR family transcriptional repressor of nem operon